MATLTRHPGFFARMVQRVRGALKAEPCPYWADYLHDDEPRKH